MAAPGALSRTVLGYDEIVRDIATTAPTTFAMATLNTGWTARFMATDTRDVYSVWVNWNAVASPGQVTVRIETIDATNGKPSGTLYDANATLAFTPAAGWQQLTFASHPTTNLVAGTEYAVVLLTTTGGTTQTLRTHFAQTAAGLYPAVVLTAADGTTRTNFAEVINSMPILTLAMSDGVEEVLNLCPFAVQNFSTIFLTNAAAAKLVIPTGITATVVAFDAILSRTGTPAGDLRFRIFDSGNNAVANTTVTVDKDSLTGVSSKHARVVLPSATPVSLAAGTYRVVLDSAASANSSNCFRIGSGQARVAGNVPSGSVLSTTPDVTLGASIVWTDDGTSQPALGLVLDSLSASGGGSAGVLYSPGLDGGAN